MSGHSTNQGPARELGRFLPDLPSCISYLLGLCLLWMMLRGGATVVQMITSPQATLGRAKIEQALSEVAKAKASPAPDAHGAESMPTPLAAIKEKIPGITQAAKETLTEYSSLDKLNSKIKSAQDAIPKIWSGILGEGEDEKPAKEESKAPEKKAAAAEQSPDIVIPNYSRF